MAIGIETLSSMLADLYGERTKKYAAGLQPLQEAAGLYGPGYMAGQERLALTGAKSALAGRGLGGTTRPQAVSAGIKAGFEDVRRQGLSGALGRISDYISQNMPSAQTLVHLATGGFSGLLDTERINLAKQQAAAEQADKGASSFPEWTGEGGVAPTTAGDYSVGKIGSAISRAGGLSPIAAAGGISSGAITTPDAQGYTYGPWTPYSDDPSRQYRNRFKDGRKAGYETRGTPSEATFGGGQGGQFGGYGASGSW